VQQRDGLGLNYAGNFFDLERGSGHRLGRANSFARNEINFALEGTAESPHSKSGWASRRAADGKILNDRLSKKPMFDPLR